MDKIKLIKSQIKQTRIMTLGLLKGISDEDWYAIPEHTGSNLAWQIGHLIIREINDTIRNIGGDLKEISLEIPLKNYENNYGVGTEAGMRLQHKPSPAVLKEKFEQAHQLLLDTIDHLSDDDLNMPLQQAAFPHPTAQTIEEVLLWNIRHEMWHCGEIAMLKRMLKSEASHTQQDSAQQISDKQAPFTLN